MAALEVNRLLLLWLLLVIVLCYRFLEKFGVSREEAEAEIAKKNQIE